MTKLAVKSAAGVALKIGDTQVNLLSLYMNSGRGEQDGEGAVKKGKEYWQEDFNLVKSVAEMGEFDILIGDWNVVGSALRDNLIESSKGTETETLSKRPFSPTTVKKRTVMNQQLSKLGREDVAGKTHKDWIVKGAGILSVGAGVDGVYLLDEKICDCSDQTCKRKHDDKAPAHCNKDASDLPMLPVPLRHFSDHFALIRRFKVKVRSEKNQLSA